jgi:hypothetical protein
MFPRVECWFYFTKWLSDDMDTLKIFHKWYNKDAIFEDGILVLII